MRKILLIICIAFVVLCYGYPCFILPFGEYKTTSGDTEITLEFKFNGKMISKAGDETKEYNYKLKGNEIIISEDKTFDDSDFTLEINNMYQVNFPLIGQFTNNIGIYTAIGIGILALVLVITIPKKR